MNANTTGKILRKLKKQEKEEGKLPLLLEFYQKILQIQSRTQQRFGTPALALSGETVKKRLQNGRPLLRFSELKLDWPMVQSTFSRVAAAFAKYPQLVGELPENLQEPGSNYSLSTKAAEAWFDGKELPQKMRDHISENIMQAMIQAALQPFLAAYARVIIDSVDQENWRRRYCPVCGGSPDLAYLEKEYGARWLLCSRCDSTWLYQRLECPCCGIQDQNALTFFSDDKELYRLYVCERCKGYLKAIDLRKTESEVLLPLERLYTLDLDKQAREYGYSPCQQALKSKDNNNAAIQ